MNIFQKASLMQKYQQDGVIVSEKMWVCVEVWKRTFEFGDYTVPI